MRENETLANLVDTLGVSLMMSYHHNACLHPTSIEFFENSKCNYRLWNIYFDKHTHVNRFFSIPARQIYEIMILTDEISNELPESAEPFLRPAT